MSSLPLSRVQISHYLYSQLATDVKRQLISAFLTERQALKPLEQLNLADEQAHQDQRHLYVIRHEAELIGLAELRVDGAKAHLRRLVIAQAFRGQDLGSKLMFHVFAQMQTLGAEALQVHADENSRHFFEKLGFIKFETLEHSEPTIFLMQHCCPNLLVQTHQKPEQAGKLLRLHSAMRLGYDSERYFYHTEQEFLGLHRTLLPQARRRIWLMTDSLQCKVLTDERTGTAFLKLVKRNPHAEIRLLLDNDRLSAGYFNPLVTVAQRLSSHIEIRTFSQTTMNSSEFVTIVDECGSIQRKALNDFTGSARFNSRVQTERLVNDFSQNWQFARPSLELRRLAI